MFASKFLVPRNIFLYGNTLKDVKTLKNLLVTGRGAAELSQPDYI